MSETPIPTKPCLLCQQPLSEGEISLNRKWHFDCQKCSYCGSGLPNSDQIEKCLRENRPVSHDTCYKTKLFRDFQSKDLVVSIDHVHMLNERINSFFPAVDPESTDLEKLEALLHELCETAASVSHALGVTKDKLRIRNNQDFQITLKKKKAEEVAEHIESEKEKIARQERTAMLAAERENPQLRLRRKAIEGAMAAMGMSREQAETWIDGQMGKQQQN